MIVEFDTELIAGRRYRIIEICETDLNPSLKQGDILTASDVLKRGFIQTRPVDGWWFADYLGEELGYGTLVRGLELIE